MRFMGYKVAVREQRPVVNELVRATVVVLASLWLAGCGALYSDSPRYGRRSASRVPAKPGPAPKPPPALQKHKGNLPWPARGAVIRLYGSVVDPKYKTTTKSPGIEIATTRGTPVVAVDSGRVSYADHFMGYGAMVIIDHGGRYHTVYSKLADITTSVGAMVRRGASIATAGDTLHFEFRIGARSVDPLDWLAPR